MVLLDYHNFQYHHGMAVSRGLILLEDYGKQFLCQFIGHWACLWPVTEANLAIKLVCCASGTGVPNELFCQVSVLKENLAS